MYVNRNVRKRTLDMCVQRRLKSACASAQSYLSLRCSSEENVLSIYTLIL